MYSRSDTNVRNYFVTEKWLKQGARSQKKGKERFLMPKWPEMLTFVFDKSEFIMLEARKYNRNRIILFVAFSLLTLGLCLYCTMAYYSIGVEIINSLSYDADSVSDAVVKILEREQQLFIYLRAYFVIQWIAALILFIITKR